MEYFKIRKCWLVAGEEANQKELFETREEAANAACYFGEVERWKIATICEIWGVETPDGNLGFCFKDDMNLSFGDTEEVSEIELDIINRYHFEIDETLLKRVPKDMTFCGRDNVPFLYEPDYGFILFWDKEKPKNLTGYEEEDCLEYIAEKKTGKYYGFCCFYDLVEFCHSIVGDGKLIHFV